MVAEPNQHVSTTPFNTISELHMFLEEHIQPYIIPDASNPNTVHSAYRKIISFSILQDVIYQDEKETFLLVIIDKLIELPDREATPEERETIHKQFKITRKDIQFANDMQKLEELGL